MQLFMSLPTQAEESFLLLCGKANENGGVQRKGRRCRLQLFMSLPTQAEESFLGAERSNENEGV